MHFLSCFLLLGVFIESVLSQTCLNKNGVPVAWFTILKAPPPVTDSRGYAYYDSTMISDKFIYYDSTVDLDNSPLTFTLSQINKDNLERVAWNDEKPDNKTSSTSAHAKGIIAYSLAAGKGILFIHSIPKYPAFLSNHSINMTINGS